MSPAREGFDHEYDLDSLRRIHPWGRDFELLITPRYRPHYVKHSNERLMAGLVGLTYSPGDPAALASAVERLVRDPKLGPQLARAGREHISRRFTRDRFSGEIYRRILRLRGAAPAEGLSLDRPLTASILRQALVFAVSGHARKPAPSTR